MCPIPPSTMTAVDKSAVVKAETSKKLKADQRTISSLSGSSESFSLDELVADRIGKAIESIARDGDLESMRQASTNVGKAFEGGSAPSISIRSYVRRIFRYVDGGSGSSDWDQLSAGTRALLIALIYIDRITQKTDLVINSLRVHRIIAVGILCALKMQEDAIVDMKFFASVAGITFEEMKSLEHSFMRLIDWDTVVSEGEFKSRVALWKRLTEPRSPMSA